MNESGFSSLVEMVANTVKRSGSHIAIRDPQSNGTYREWSYDEFWRGVRQIAGQLQRLCVTNGDRVAIISENRVWWPMADLAIMSLGALTVTVYPNVPVSQVEFILKHSAVKGVFAEDPKQVEKVFEAIPEARENMAFAVICEGEFSGRAAAQAQVDGLQTVQFFDWLAADDLLTEEAFDSLFAPLNRDCPASIIYTSGTTGTPKGAVLTHGNMLSNVEGIAPIVPIYGTDTSISYLPLSHIFERTASQWYNLYVGGCITYSRGIDVIVEEFQTVRPTTFTTVPRLLEKVHEGILQKMAASPSMQRKLFDRAIVLGERARVEHKPVSAAKLAFYEKLVFSKVKQLFGGNLRLIVSGGAPLPPHVFRFLTALGLTVVEGYGLTETSPVIAVNASASPQMGVVGKVLANVEARIEADGELVVRGPSISPGYYQNEEATQKAFVDGWFHTGDIAEFTPEGYLKITDRKKNLLILSTGKNVAPAPIESEILASPLIDQVLLFGHGRKFVGAIVVPNESILKRATAEGAPDRSALASMMLDVVKQQTATFAGFEQPKQVIVSLQQFTIENGLLTPTLKIKANLVLKMFADEIEALYQTAEKPKSAG